MREIIKEKDEIDKLFDKLNDENLDISSCKEDYLKLLNCIKSNDFTWELNVIFNRFNEFRRQGLLKEDDFATLKSKFDSLNLSKSHEFEVAFQKDKLQEILKKSNISNLDKGKNISIKWEQKYFVQTKSVKNKISRIFWVLTILVVLVVLVLAICYLCIGGDIWTFLTKE